MKSYQHYLTSSRNVWQKSKSFFGIYEDQFKLGIITFPLILYFLYSYNVTVVHYLNTKPSFTFYCENIFDCNCILTTQSFIKIQEISDIHGSKSF